MIVTVDVGASKVRAGLFSQDPISSDAIYNRYLTSQWSGLVPLLRAFVDESGGPEVHQIVVGVAGPVVGTKASMTNLAWEFDCHEIQRAFPTANVALVNDLVAHGYGTLELNAADLIEVKPGNHRPGNRALIAAGSGLGECLIFWDGAAHTPTPSEGGHADFAPRDDIQIELLRFLQRRHPAHVSWERVISGNYGFQNLYSFLVSRGMSKVEDIENAISERLPLGPLVHAFAEKGDPTVLATIALFFDLYAAEAGNLALKTFAVDGVYISGGVARKLQEWLDLEHFSKVFASKGRMSDLLADIPVYLVTDPNSAVKGLAAYARREIGTENSSRFI